MLRGARNPVENTGAVVENQGGASALWKTRVLANRSMFNKTTRPTCLYPSFPHLQRSNCNSWF